MRYNTFNQNNEIATARKAIQEERKDIDRKNKPFCIYCKKRGHVREHCWKLKKNKEDEIVPEAKKVPWCR
jgi:hydrogenase maturation factor HypF (carbamoyltransferase family)